MKKLALLLPLLLLALSCRQGEEAADGEAAAKQTARGAQKTSTAVGTELGARMPEYSAVSLDGTQFDLSSRGDKVVLLNIWATWCPPCRVEIPELQALHDRYAARGFEVLGVSVDDAGVEPVRGFVEEQKITYPVVVDAQGKVADLFKTSVLPTSALIDRNGTIVWKQVGMIEKDDEALKKAIEAAL